MNIYMSMFKMIQIQYNEILRVSEELYQIVDIYIQNFITKKNEYNFDTKDFHMKMFNYIVFNDQIIRSFINHMIDHHNAKAFRPKKYKAFLNALNEFIQFFQ